MVKNFILNSKVFHKRYSPKINKFNYSTYYIILDMLKPLNQHKTKIFSFNKMNLFSFYDKDHGYRNNSHSVEWAKNILNKNSLLFDSIKLITMPRILGYLFNPVSFWVCYKNEKIISIIVEVNNTFKETHSYLCHKNNDEITNKCWFEAKQKKYFMFRHFIKDKAIIDLNFH